MWGLCQCVCGVCECVGCGGVCVWVSVCVGCVCVCDCGVCLSEGVGWGYLCGCEGVCVVVSVGMSVCVRLQPAPSVPRVCPLRKPNSPRAGPFLHALAPHAGLGRGCCAW